ncbi:polyprenyl synthetase family protein [Plantactinospora sp. B5E13]|uniref:polyprenyl synthetase family protein n=1 Tax=unclassified Plantactinospora TaxID=2631981 RepID=UPI00325CBB66
MTMMLPSILTQVDELVQPEIRAALERIDERTRLVAGYQFGYWDATGAPTGRSGKGLRPALALLSARVAGQPVGRGLPAAVAVELVHNFSLLHDDVIDGDLERRHRPTAWAAFGVGPAILAGDALLGLADEVLCAAPELDVHRGLATLHTAVRRLIAGQAADVEFENRSDVTLDECLAMARDKTAALLACAATLGAVVCGAPQTVVDGLDRYGERLGLAFQLVDDLLGIWGEPAVTGKPVLSDLRARKKSVPVVRALGVDGPAATRLAELYASPGDLSAADLALAANLIEETGARDWTEKQADRLLTEALAELDQLGEVGSAGGADVSGVHADLVAIAHFMTGRDY